MIKFSTGNLKLSRVIMQFCIATSFATAVLVSAYAAEQTKVIPAYDVSLYNQSIQKLYQTVPNANSPSIADRVAAISQYFVGVPYVEGNLGEGPTGDYDQDPLYRTDAFDCVTFVSTVVALAQANNLSEFNHTIRDINYRDGQPKFANRNHFVEVDWNPNNERKGYIQDITNTITDQNGKPIAVNAVTVIDKPGWFQKLDLSHLKFLQTLSSDQQEQKLMALQQEGNKFKPQTSTVPYLPLTKLFDANGQPIQAIFNQIPSGSVIEIVRPNWQLKDLIGTNMNISHLGLAIRTPKGLIYREASSKEHKVIDIPLTDYLKDYLHSTTVKGINIQKIKFAKK